MARTPAVLSAVFAMAALSLTGCRATTTTAGASSPASVAPPAVSPTASAPASGATPVPVKVSPPIPPPAVTPRCGTPQLRAQLAEPDGAAGNRYQKLTLHNVGAACRMWGWVSLQLEGPGVGLVPTSVAHTGTPTAFTLASGGTASTLLHWNVVPTGSEPTSSDCEPVASQLRVYPPGQSTARVPAWTYGPVCGHGQFDVAPMAP